LVSLNSLRIRGNEPENRKTAIRQQQNPMCTTDAQNVSKPVRCRTLTVRQRYLPPTQTVALRLHPTFCGHNCRPWQRSLRLVNSKTSRATAFAGNLPETIPLLHGSFAVLFFRLFSRQTSNPEWEPQRGLRYGTASNRDFLSIGGGLSEIGPALATGILDGSSAAFLSV
jgi:hypothetical protein